MKTRPLLTALPLLLLVAACGVRTEAPGDVTFTWTFNHGQSCLRAGVDHVQVAVEGQVLDNGGNYPCLDASQTPGVTLTAFRGGTYPFSLTAFDASGNALYGREGTFDVHGNIQVPVDLAPTAGSAPVTLTWAYQVAANAPHCGQDFDEVEVDVDATPFGHGTLYNCADGAGAGVLSPPLGAGGHTLTVLALDSAAQGTVFASGAVNVAGGAGGSAAVPLTWEIGGVALAYNLTEDPSVPACVGSGLSVKMDFEDVVTHQLLYGAGGTSVPACQVPVVFFLPVSNNPYQVQIQALGGGHEWDPSPANPTQVTLSPGVFGDPQNPYFVPMVQTR